MTGLCARIPQLSTEEKLTAMEAMWASLHEHVEASDPPEWHREVLRERRQQIESGSAVYEGWQSGKSELRGLREGYWFYGSRNPASATTSSTPSAPTSIRC